MNNEAWGKAALKERAQTYIHATSPYTQWLRDEKRNHEAFEYLLREPLKAANFYASYLAAKSELPEGFEQWSPEERLAHTVDSLAHLYNEGYLGGLLPSILQDVRENPTLFGHADREAVDKMLATAPPDVQAMAVEADRLQIAEAISMRAADRDIEAGKTPKVLAEGDELAQAAARMEADDSFQLRAAVAAAYDRHAGEAEAQAPRFGDGAEAYTDAEYREAVRDALRDGSCSQAEALELLLHLDREAIVRGEVKPYVPRNDQELAVKQAYRLHEIQAALAAGEIPPAAVEYVAQADGLTPAFAPRAAGPQPFDLRAAQYGRHGLRGMNRRDAAELAYESLLAEATGQYSPELTGEPTDDDLKHDAEVVARLDSGTETVRDVIEAAADLADSEPSAEHERAPRAVSTREALNAAWDHHATDSRWYEPVQHTPDETLRETLERAFGAEEANDSQ